MTATSTRRSTRHRPVLSDGFAPTCTCLSAPTGYSSNCFRPVPARPATSNRSAVLIQRAAAVTRRDPCAGTDRSRFGASTNDGGYYRLVEEPSWRCFGDDRSRNGEVERGAQEGGAGGGNRTLTGSEPHGILSPARLPISPLRPVEGVQNRSSEYTVYRWRRMSRISWTTFSGAASAILPARTAPRTCRYRASFSIASWRRPWKGIARCAASRFSRGPAIAST